MLYVWLRSHFRCEKSAFTKAYFPHTWPIKEFCESEWTGPKTKEGWIAFLQTVSDTEIIWLAPWMPYVPLLYRCGDKPWVQLPGLWGAVSYAPLMVVRQLGGKQFIPATAGLTQLEFSYDDPIASKEIDRIVKSWKQTFRVNTGLVGNKVTMEYAVWKARRPRDLMIPPRMDREPIASQEGPSDLEIAKQLFDEEMKKMRVKRDRKSVV